MRRAMNKGPERIRGQIRAVKTTAEVKREIHEKKSLETAWERKVGSWK